ncbi:MAG TPA: phosphatase domain-containing protein [Burkholderiales bacterium]|nr:phosphatase domain-containing protein [Burkholderiales bacterium]
MPAPPRATARKGRWLIEPYLGYGTPSRILISGRVLEDRGLIESSRLDSKWRNLRNTFRRFSTREIPDACVRAFFSGTEAAGVTDAEGYFWLTLDMPTPAPGRSWQQIELELHDRDGGVVCRASAEALIPPQTARFGVISDIDDTVVTTNVTSTPRMLATVLFSNAYVRTPFHGIAALYRALHAGASGGEGNPIFYVSNGPWNFFGLLTEFFKVHGIPVGPLFLRDFSPRILFESDEMHARQKRLHIDQILETYPALPFVLIGDSGERDPEIYADVVKRHPGRIRAIYIRCVDRRRERLAGLAALAEAVSRTSTQFVLAPDSAYAAAHAAGEGLIARSALPRIAARAR